MKGFNYTAVAIEQYYNQLSSAPSIMTIYQSVGEILGVSSTSVEKGIRDFVQKLYLGKTSKAFIAGESYRLLEVERGLKN